MMSLANALRWAQRVLDNAGIRRENFDTDEEYEAAANRVVKAAADAEAEEARARLSESGEVWL